MRDPADGRGCRARAMFAVVRRRGFTLVEVLVVVAIIAVLAAILFPVLAQARERARAATCTSNLGQLAKALLMYADDYDGKLPEEWYPDGDGWRGSLQPYVKNEGMFLCPSQSKGAYISYGLPAWVAYEAYWTGSAKLRTASQPSTTVLVAENWSSYYSTRDPVHWPSPWFPDDNNVAWDRHHGGANYAFADGHVKRLTRDQTYHSVCIWWAWTHEPFRGCGGRTG